MNFKTNPLSQESLNEIRNLNVLINIILYIHKMIPEKETRKWGQKSELSKEKKGFIGQSIKRPRENFKQNNTTKKGDYK